MKKLEVELFGLANPSVDAKEVDIAVGDIAAHQDTAANVVREVPARLDTAAKPGMYAVVDSYLPLHARRVVRDLDRFQKRAIRFSLFLRPAEERRFAQGDNFPSISPLSEVAARTDGALASKGDS